MFCLKFIRQSGRKGVEEMCTCNTIPPTTIFFSHPDPILLIVKLLFCPARQSGAGNCAHAASSLNTTCVQWRNVVFILFICFQRGKPQGGSRENCLWSEVLIPDAPPFSLPHPTTFSVAGSKFRISLLHINPEHFTIILAAAL